MNPVLSRLIGAADWLRGVDVAAALIDSRGRLVERNSSFGDYSLNELPIPFLAGRNTYQMSGMLFPWTVIGRYCSISRAVDIGVPPPPQGRAFATGDRSTAMTSGAPSPELDDPITVIGCDVWLGAMSCILAGVRIGHGAVIGGGAVVTEDVPPYAIIGGNPARLIRYRFPEDLITRLLASQWWMLPADLVSRLPKNDIETSLRIARGYRPRV